MQIALFLSWFSFLNAYLAEGLFLPEFADDVF